MIQTIIFYGLWFSLVTTLTIFYNTLVNSPGLVAALTFGTTIGLSIMTSLFDHLVTVSQVNLSKHIQQMLLVNEVSTDLINTALITIVLISSLLVGSVYIFKN